MAIPEVDYTIVYLKSSLNLSELSELDSTPKTNRDRSTLNQTNDIYIEDDAELIGEIKKHLPTLAGELRIFDDKNLCYHYFDENTSSNHIFFVISDSSATNIFIQMTETWKSIKKIYILGDCSSSIANWIDRCRKYDIDVLCFDLSKNLLIRLLQDISQYYRSKGEYLKNQNPSSTDFALTYFGRAKEIMTCVARLADNDFKDQIDYIESQQNEVKQSIRRTNSTIDIEEKLKRHISEEDRDSVAIIFTIGEEIKLIHLDPDIAHIITCESDDQVILSVTNLKISTPIIVVSSTLPTPEILALSQLLNYSFFCKAEQIVNTSNVTYVCSIDHLISHLYHKLGQHYRESAFQAFANESKNPKMIMRLLDRSKQCYELLGDDTNKILKHYAKIMEKNLKD
ncbi:hypothetical protein I4U23_003552 [Adineta vaga]|nr:hypothetical protein I4U23_003552 [Adineta vaga]